MELLRSRAPLGINHEIALDTDIPIQGAVKTVLFHERPRFLASPGGEQTQFSPEFSPGLGRFPTFNRDKTPVIAPRRRLGTGRQAR
jgi:hypothetical protein